MTVLALFERAKALHALAALAIMLVGGDARAEDSVKCTCPEIKADGFGNSACSANESGNRCRVAFNQFRQDAISLSIKQFGQKGFRLNSIEAASAPAGLSASKRYQFLEVKPRVEAVAVSLSMAAAYANAFTEDDADQIYRALVLDGNVRDFVAAAFSREAVERGQNPPYLGPNRQPEHPQRFIAGSTNVWATDGCVLVKTRSSWFLYKTEWSPARALPQCGPIL